jgi:hypothetical protein
MIRVKTKEQKLHDLHETTIPQGAAYLGNRQQLVLTVQIFLNVLQELLS